MDTRWSIFEYAFGKVNEVVEDERRRRNVGTTGVRALSVPVAGLLLIFAFALSLPCASLLEPIRQGGAPSPLPGSENRVRVDAGKVS